VLPAGNHHVRIADCSYKHVRIADYSRPCPAVDCSCSLMSALLTIRTQVRIVDCSYHVRIADCSCLCPILADCSQTMSAFRLFIPCPHCCVFIPGPHCRPSRTMSALSRLARTMSVYAHVRPPTVHTMSSLPTVHALSVHSVLFVPSCLFFTTSRPCPHCSSLCFHERGTSLRAIHKGMNVRNE
jgi:hypothetical protein